MFVNVALDFQDIPAYLVEELNFPSEYVAGLFATIVFIAIVVIPFVATRNTGLGLLIGGMIVFVCVGIGWIDSWIVIFQVMLVAGLFTFGILKKLY